MLADVILESELSVELVEKLFDATVETKYRKGDKILEQGDTSAPIFIVTEGLLRMFYYDSKGNDITHWFAAEENIITDPATYFDQAPSNYLIEALEDCTVRSLKLKELNRLCKEHHAIEYFGRLLTLRIAMELNRKLMDIQFKSAKERYVTLIESKPDIFQRTKLGHIASYLGITQVSLSRIRSEL
jgi:CRP-like cAMP-binding protein